MIDNFHNDFIADDGKKFTDRHAYISYCKSLIEHQDEYRTEQACYEESFVLPSWAEEQYYLYLFNSLDEYNKTLSYLSMRWAYDEVIDFKQHLPEPPEVFPALCAFTMAGGFIRRWDAADMCNEISNAGRAIYKAYEDLAALYESKRRHLEENND